MDDSLPLKESLTVEFKSDRKSLSDRELIEALTCVANAEGGELWLGIEDDGTPTGLHANHHNLEGLSGLVAARTSPSLQVRVSRHHFANVDVAKIMVPKSSTEIATTGGMYLRRRLVDEGKLIRHGAPRNVYYTKFDYLKQCHTQAYAG